MSDDKIKYSVDYKSITVKNVVERIAIISFEEEIALNKNIEVKNILTEITKEDIKYLIVNLDETKYIDSSGLGIFLGTLKNLKAKNGDLLLTNMNQYIKSIFKLIHLDIVIKIFESLDECYKHLESL